MNLLFLSYWASWSTFLLYLFDCCSLARVVTASAIHCFLSYCNLNFSNRCRRNYLRQNLSCPSGVDYYILAVAHSAAIPRSHPYCQPRSCCHCYSQSHSFRRTSHRLGPARQVATIGFNHKGSLRYRAYLDFPDSMP